MYMQGYCVHMTGECGCPQRSEEANERPGAGATGSCELSYVSPGKGPQALCNHCAISPAHVDGIFRVKLYIAIIPLKEVM